MTDVIYIGIILALLFVSLWLFLVWLSVREDMEIEEQKHCMTWDMMDAARAESRHLRDQVKAATPNPLY